MSALDLDPAQQSVDTVLTTTRAVRRRLELDRPVPHELLLECLDLALQAPSGANRQPWRWLFVEDAERKAALASCYRMAWRDYIAEQDVIIASLDNVDRANAIRMRKSAAVLADDLERVPVLVLPCALERLGPKPSTHEMAALYGSIFPAVWGFQLALRSRGLGSSFTTLHLEHEAAVADILGIPSTVTQIGMLPVGFYRGTTFARASRRPAVEVSYWNQWGTK
jgi:nitroreductase